MNVNEAKAEVFWLAFKSMPKQDQRSIVEKLLLDKDFRQDLIDMSIIEQRRDEPSRPLSDYLAERG
jgi:hypothetical protein